MKWPASALPVLKKDPFTAEERYLCEMHAADIERSARGGYRFHIRRADGTWFTVVGASGRLSSPVNFNIKEK